MLSQYIYVRRTKGPSLYHSYFFLTNWHSNLYLQISRNKDRPIPSPPLLAGLFFIGCDLWILNFGKPFLWESDVNFSRPVLSTLRPFTACSRPVYGLQFSTAKFIFIRPVLSYFAVATATWQHCHFQAWLKLLRIFRVQSSSAGLSAVFHLLFHGPSVRL